MKRKVVFVHVPKTGGLSIRAICQQHRIIVITHDIRSRNYVSLERYKSIDPTCFAFAFVRNPWDRVVSAYFYLKRGGDREEDRKDAEVYLPYDDFKSFVLGAFKTETIFEQLHFTPQYRWLSDKSNLLVDSVARFENLQEDFSKYCGLFNLPNYKLPVSNKSVHAEYKTYYDDQTWSIVANAYRRDIDLFGYAGCLRLSPASS
ncbi:MAG: sulfotransferase family 2 domain-containing protein [Rudaea sp.]|nr:sulfotransferase family 2 domain-containing protein [Rudaea sp.]